MGKSKVLIALLFEELSKDGTVIYGIDEETGEKYNDMENVISEMLEDQQVFNKVEEKIFDMLQEEIQLYIKKELQPKGLI